MLQIDPIVASDVPWLVGLHALCFPTEPWDRVSIAGVLAMPDAFGVCATKGQSGAAVGFALARTMVDQCEILSLGVHPADRRQGIGRCLLRGMLDLLTLRGSSQAFLEVAEDNLAARRLYLDEGFVIIGIRPNYYSRQDARFCDALILRRELSKANTWAGAGRQSWTRERVGRGAVE